MILESLILYGACKSLHECFFVKPVPKKNVAKIVDKEINTEVDEEVRLATVNQAALALATVNLITPSLPLTALSLLGSAYWMRPTAERALHKLVKEKKVGHDLLMLSSSSMLAILGQPFIIALGHWMYTWGRGIEKKAKGESQKALSHLLQQQPINVWQLKDGLELEVPLSQLQIGDVIVVNAGDVLPVDGVVIEGHALVDQHLLTGEFQPAEKGAGEQALASTIVLSGRICVQIAQSGQETVVAKLEQAITHTLEHKTQAQLKGEQWADKSSMYFLAAGGAALLTGGLLPASTVLMSSIGGSIRVVAPLGTLNYLQMIAKQGILVKQGDALERLSEIDTVLFDKTGTLTTDEPIVGAIQSYGAYTRAQILRYAAIAESRLNHPIANAILKAAQEQCLEFSMADSKEYRIGYGVTVQLDDLDIKVGSARFMLEEGINLQAAQKTLSEAENSGYSIIMVAIDHVLQGSIEVRPKLRNETAAIMAGLRARGIKHLAVVSGDQQQPTRNLAQTLGMDQYFYDVLPEQKAEIVEQLQGRGQKVCFVGDGVNDCLAMQKADIAISLQGASAIAVDTAQIVFLDGDIGKIGLLFDTAKALQQNHKTSLAISAAPPMILLSSFLFLDELDMVTMFVVKKGSKLAGFGNAMRPKLITATANDAAQQKLISKH